MARSSLATCSRPIQVLWGWIAHSTFQNSPKPSLQARQKSQQTGHHPADQRRFGLRLIPCRTPLLFCKFSNTVPALCMVPSLRYPHIAACCITQAVDSCNFQAFRSSAKRCTASLTRALQAIPSDQIHPLKMLSIRYLKKKINKNNDLKIIEFF